MPVARVRIDPDFSWLEFARDRGGRTERYCQGRAEALPFADRNFDYTASLTGLCFVADQRSALLETLRVTRKRFAVGLLNRRSLLSPQKERDGGTGAYRGAHWHTSEDIHALATDCRPRASRFEPRLYFPMVVCSDA